MFDVIGGDILSRSVALVRAGGTLVTIAMPPEVHPKDGRAVFFVVEPDRARLADLATRLRDGRLKLVVGAVRRLAEAPAAFTPDKRTPGRRSWRHRRLNRRPVVIGMRIAGDLLAATAGRSHGLRRLRPVRPHHDSDGHRGLGAPLRNPDPTAPAGRPLHTHSSPCRNTHNRAPTRV